jgi:2-succinyl-5-enolpyruvyl-6-hydroxy-3-cyclohexene-1-carboxylate synthase
VTYYTSEKHAQIVIALLRAHGIRHIIASPGTTNMAFVGSVQTDPYFTVYSAVDERSAAYMACGLAAQTGEPIVLSCTGATASRNYLPGLTEAFYRKLPVLALTSMQGRARAGHHIAQVIDRSELPADVAKLSVDLPVVTDAETVWECEMKVNRALLELTRRGCGPVHINLPTTYSRTFNERTLPEYRIIERWTVDDSLPKISAFRVGIMVGAHQHWTAELTAAVDRFCEVNNAAVFCDHTSGYRGKYRILGALLGGQEGNDKSDISPDLAIHIGEVSGDYYMAPMTGKETWRVSPDGELRDTFRKLRHIFEMPELAFFNTYGEGDASEPTFYASCKRALETARSLQTDLPFSNIWLASQIAPLIPAGSVVHFAILNSLRSWNFFEIADGVTSASNVGGFGIDGCMSTLIGASLADPDRLFFLIIGDLAFFYDMNALGNRHLGANVRILLVNNGKGTEFTQYGHPGSAFANDPDRFVAADGHFGRQSRDLVKHYAEALGLDYLAIDNKTGSEGALERLVSDRKYDRSLIVEAFVDPEDESKALKTMKTLDPTRKTAKRERVKTLLGPKLVRTAKRILRR